MLFSLHATSGGYKIHTRQVSATDAFRAHRAHIRSTNTRSSDVLAPRRTTEN